jgi:surface carbohydrate biosynthesis protein
MMNTIAIPLETKVREFDGKAWLAMNLLEQGNQVVMGPSYELAQTLDIIEPDIYITKDPGDGRVEFFDRLQSAGILICGIDTEGAVFESMDTFAGNKKKLLNHIDAFFAWGQKPANAIRQNYDNTDHIYVTGAPSFDLLQARLRFIYQDRAAPLNEQYGDYILFNGNFSFANPFGQQVITKAEEVYGSISQEKYTFYHRIFHLFLDTLYHVQNEFPETNVIIRPHPSEDNTTYEEAFRGYDRIHVKDTGDARNWIAGASVTVHHDCTTGIESALMGVPVASYRPIQNEKYESELPQVASKQVFTLDELTKYVSQSLRSEQPYEMDADQTAHLKQYFHNVDESAAENICNVIDSLEVRTEKNYDRLKPDLRGDVERRVKSSRGSDQVIAAYDGVQKLLGNESRREQRQYQRQKFPGLKREEILQRIEQMKKFLHVGSFSVEAVPLTNDTFYIRTK